MAKPSPRTTSFHVDVLESADALRAVAEDWDDLWQRSDVTMPTLCAEPAASWIETFAPNTLQRILTVRQDNRLVGALPIVGRKLRRVVPVGDVPLNQWSANGDLLIDAETDVAAVTSRLAETIRDLPTIWSYAFADGSRRGLILLSLDTSKPHAVSVAFDDKVAGSKAHQWLLTAEKITANNEFESAQPQVRVIERTINDFQSGARLNLPPFSMLAVSWETD